MPVAKTHPFVSTGCCTGRTRRHWSIRTVHRRVEPGQRHSTENVPWHWPATVALWG